MKISERLKELREKRGMSKLDFASLLNVPYTTYMGYETGSREPKMNVLEEFSNKLEITLSELLGLTTTFPTEENNSQKNQLSSYANIIEFLFTMENLGLIYELIQHDSYQDEPNFVPIEFSDHEIKLFIMQWCRMKYVLQQGMIDEVAYKDWKSGIIEKYSKIRLKDSFPQ